MYYEAVIQTFAIFISKEKFIEILKQKYPLDYEKYCLIRDELNNYNNHALLESKCISCSEKSGG